MNIETGSTYPNGYIIRRTVQAGGVPKSELIQELQKNAIALNESAETLLASDLFVTSAAPYTITLVELTVRNLGFPEGAATAEIYERAAALGLALCPLELGPHLRLQYLDQPEGALGQPVRQHRAPSGSITIASAPPGQDDEFPKGFYLRRIEGTLWLRGYHAGAEHIWDPDDHFIFRQTEESIARTTY